MEGTDACFVSRRMLFDTGRLLIIYCAGALATVIATLVAFKLLPLTSLGADSWKVLLNLITLHFHLSWT